MDNKLPTSAKSWFVLHPTGMQIIRPPDIEEYLEVGETLTNITYAIQFWWGDYILHGEGRADWGEMYSQALEESGRAYHTLTKAVSVCRKLPLEVRREDVPFSTHAVIAKLSNGENDMDGQDRAKRWLDYTAERKMAGKDVAVLMSAFLEPPADLRYENELQRSALIVTNQIRGELPEPQEVPVSDDLLSEISVLTDKLDRAIDVLTKVWEAWPSPVSDEVLREVEDVIQSSRDRSSDNDQGIGRGVGVLSPDDQNMVPQRAS